MLCRSLGLRYGAADLILSTEGEYVFLEVNPGGQFLFVEIQAGVPISDAIADALVSGPPQVRRHVPRLGSRDATGMGRRSSVEFAA